MTAQDSTTPLNETCWINALPDELISMILVSALPSALCDGASNVGDRIRFPIVVQLVCRRWDRIALATPALWAILCIKPPQNRSFISYLQRSGVMPLEVHLDSLSENGVTRIEAIQPVLQILADRIWKLVIQEDYVGDVHATMNQIPFHLNNLLELSAIARSDSENPTQIDLAIPRLRSLYLVNYSLDWMTLPVGSSLEHISVTEAAACDIPLKSLIDTLRSCPFLRTLKLHNQLITGCDDRRVLEMLEPVSLEWLETMNLTCFFRRELRAIFGLILAPRVKVLFIHGLLNNHEADHSKGPLVLHFPVLQTLVVKKIDLALEITKQFPDVKHLAFMYDHERDSQLEMDREFGSLCKHWRSLPSPLPLETLKTDGVSMTSLVRFLERDRHAVAPFLHKISIHGRAAFLGRENSEEAFQLRAEERNRLAEMVDLEVFGAGGVSPFAQDRTFESWEDRRAWLAIGSGINAPRLA